ncbi:MAG: hypothetical protein K2L89_02115 [Muribaculaceae bacterium]|nr:hypothetical protein [Muribaculaceae bacterium]
MKITATRSRFRPKLCFQILLLSPLFFSPSYPSSHSLLLPPSFTSAKLFPLEALLLTPSPPSSSSSSSPPSSLAASSPPAFLHLREAVSACGYAANRNFQSARSKKPGLPIGRPGFLY